MTTAIAAWRSVAGLHRYPVQTSDSSETVPIGRSWIRAGGFYHGLVKRLLGVLLAIAGGTGGLASPGATAPAPTVCRFEAEFTLSPGLGLVPTSGAFTSGGEQGTVSCDGPVDGARPTGAGTFGAAGDYRTPGPDGCSSGEGTALQSFTVPTRDGPFRFTNAVRFTWHPEPALTGDPDAPLAIAVGEFHGPEMSGTLVIIPEEGDCVTAPATRVVVHLEGTVTHDHGGTAGAASPRPSAALRRQLVALTRHR